MIRCWSALLLGVFGWVTTSQAIELVGVNEAMIGWTEATGQVETYGVFVDRDGLGTPLEPEQIVGDNFVTVAGNYGERLVIQVAAFDSNGHRSPLSEPMEAITFVDPVAGIGDDPQPTGEIYFSEDFESHGPDEDPIGWVDTQEANALTEDSDLFKTIVLDDGSVAFGTYNEQRAIHSHIVLADSATWSGYEVSGAIYIGSLVGGAGVTLYSDFPNSDTYYRFHRKPQKPFKIGAHSSERFRCKGDRRTRVNPRPGLWYNFRFQAYPEVGGTRLRLKIWDSEVVEPAGWPVDCVDPAAIFQAGTIGIWSRGKGLKLWDDIQVIGLE